MPASESTLSPWQVVLGERFNELHPRLRVYFQAIPAGSVGFGEGVFDIVGSSRWWVRELLRLFVDEDVVIPVWARHVPFTVINRPAKNELGPAVTAERTFLLSKSIQRSGDRVMRDRISATPMGIVDVLGARRRLRALFVTEVVDGQLRMTSSRMAVRIGRQHFLVPRVVAPTVTLTERFSDDDECQHVALVLRVPLVGRVYEYAGSFSYEIRLDDA